MIDRDREWDELPIAELEQLDAVCVRFDQTLAHAPETRIESFVDDLTEPQQRLVVLELVEVEIERRHARGQRPTPDEYALRFPRWADELHTLASQRIGELDREGIVAPSETVNQNTSSNNDTKTNQPAHSDALSPAEQTNALHESWRARWRASTSGLPRSDLPEDGVLGHYLLQSVIGRGGMGIVVRAHDTKLARDVAIKFLASEISQVATAKERFLREARAAAAIRHKNVVTIHAVEEIDEHPLLVMELVEGMTLDEYLRANGKLAADEVASLAYQMAQGLAAAHQRSLTHRDVKPANIILEKDDQRGNARRASSWNVKIADFGLACVAAELRLTSSGLIAGTPQYMSPEQANGQELDTRSDLFSLGSVMYAMCAGKPPFEAESAIAITRLVADKPARSLREVSPQMPVWLIEIIETLMAKSPDERFQLAAEVAELLSAHAHELQFGSFPLASKPSGGAPRRNLPISLLVGACFIALMAVAAGVTFFLSTKRGAAAASHSEQLTNYVWPQNTPAPAIAPFTPAEAKAHQEAWAKHLGVAVEMENSIGTKFVLIPPGEFMMGSTPKEIEAALKVAGEVQLWKDTIRSEAPQHKVILTQPIYMSVHEVTQKEYETVMGTNPSCFSAVGAGRDAVRDLDTTRHPVEFVSWNDATEFCARLSQREELKPIKIDLRAGEIVRNERTGYRLPTEAEWEFACRAGTTTKYWISDKDEDLPRAGWFRENSGGRSHAIGELMANPLGLCDMHGNVWEWVEDAWDQAYYDRFAEQAAVNPNSLLRSHDQRVFRGGNWGDDASRCRASDRGASDPTGVHYHIGFRVVLVAGRSHVGRP